MTGEDKQTEYHDTEWLHDAVWRWETYKKPRPLWNHEHCVFCPRRIAEADYGDPEALQTAYTTTFTHEEGDAGYEWVCPDCFTELREIFRWRVQETV
jgi:hypothetical protein